MLIQRNNASNAGVYRVVGAWRYSVFRDSSTLALQSGGRNSNNFMRVTPCERWRNGDEENNERVFHDTTITVHSAHV
jgi:hypothetical protein